MRITPMMVMRMEQPQTMVPIRRKKRRETTGTKTKECGTKKLTQKQRQDVREEAAAKEAGRD
jgi:hypothetical protein